MKKLLFMTLFFTVTQTFYAGALGYLERESYEDQAKQWNLQDLYIARKTITEQLNSANPTESRERLEEKLCIVNDRIGQLKKVD